MRFQIFCEIPDLAVGGREIQQKWAPLYLEVSQGSQTSGFTRWPPIFGPLVHGLGKGQHSSGKEGVPRVLENNIFFSHPPCSSYINFIYV